MNKVLFTQDLGVPRSFINSLLNENKLGTDWSLADNKEVQNLDDIVCICTASIPLTTESLSKFKNLRIVSMSFTGYDHVDKDYCEKNDIKVFNVPAYSTDSVAELAIGLAIGLLRKIPLGNSEVRKGNWNENVPGFELANKTCGIIGTGTIGCRLAELLAAFKCNIKAWSRTEKDEIISKGGSYVSLNELFKECDLVFITVSLNENTRNLVSGDQLDLMKDSSYLINVARGPVVNRADLIMYANSGKISGFGIDVYDYEPLKKDDELRNISNSIMTPHVAYRTKEALERKASVTAQNIIAGLKGGEKNRVI